MVFNASNIIRTTSVLALMGSGAAATNHNSNNNNNSMMGGIKKKKQRMKTANKIKRAVGQQQNNNRRDLTEDIQFWTRMTQAGSLPPIPPPTPNPVGAGTPLPTDFAPVPTDPPVPVPLPTDPPVPPATDPPVPPATDPPVSPAPTVALLCGLTPEQRATQLRQMALSITSETTLNNPNSPQSKALQWLISEDQLEVCPGDGPCGSRQRYIMASFYYAAGGGTWNQCNAPTVNDGKGIEEANANCERAVTPFPVQNPRIGDKSTDAWLTPVDECEWGGLACWGTDDNRNGCMDQIDFENDGLSGSLVPEMVNLNQLRFFILEQGTIGGPIPSEYGQFEKLLIFDLDFNDLSGAIPDELFNMNVLQQLDLNDNELDGTISTNIGSLKTLTFLQLDHNKLTGTIPTEVGELTALRIAFFNDNDLTGVMPADVCALRNNTSPPGFLGTLVADCNPPEDPQIECSCCSSCNVV